MNLMIVEETPKLEIGGKTSQGLLWRTFRRQVSSRVENVEKVSQGIPSPYWNYDYTSTPVLSKSNAGIGQRIFTGHEYDGESDLTYAKQRYYDQDIGRFLSVDLFARDIPHVLITDPQQLNQYTYTRNNPLSFVDPTGLLTAIIPGTDLDGDGKGGLRDTGPEQSEFISNVEGTFNDYTIVLQWSGSNDAGTREDVANAYAKVLSQYNYSEGEKLNIVGFSHGGNIANMISGRVSRKVDNLVTLGTPVRSNYQPQYGNIGTHFNLYSRFDAIQRIGELGDPFTVTGVDPRKFNGAINKSVGLRAGFLPRTSHSNLWKNSSVWSLVDSLVGPQ